MYWELRGVETKGRGSRNTETGRESRASSTLTGRSGKEKK